MFGAYSKPFHILALRKDVEIVSEPDKFVCRVVNGFCSNV
jgi:hypothetical protein